MSQERFSSRRGVRRDTRSRSPRRRAPEEAAARVRATEQRAESATEQRSERSWSFFKAITDELETWSENPWSLEEWYGAVQSADTREMRFGATRNISTMARAATYMVRARAREDDNWIEGAENILKTAHHIARQYRSGATEHGLKREVLKLLYDFLNTRLEAAAIMFAIDRALRLDGDSDDAADLERRLRVDILEEAQRRANARGSEIKVALGLSASL